ncbi:hypothetical protein Syun_006373 [Stephania yunnanensis]|uniref:BUB1 N-terminal domain-containing protein n=1 Tax=Stephania yunnanensis TaxID=152371 RepID=A0AAP0KWF6_9MAGN
MPHPMTESAWRCRDSVAPTFATEQVIAYEFQRNGDIARTILCGIDFWKAENCADAQVIYNFLEANGIGQTHTTFYIAYALHMESKSKLKIANEVFNLGIARLDPVHKESMDDHVQVRSFGAVLATGEASKSFQHLLPFKD